MAEIRGFKALRYTEKAGDIASLVCPPYDIVNDEQRRSLISLNPYNMIQLELPAGSGDEKYSRSAQTVSEFIKSGLMAREEDESVYVYEMLFDADGTIKSVRGLVCAVRLEEFEKKIILPHEETLSAAKEDRFKLMCAAKCNFSSIYSLYSDKAGRIGRVIGDRREKPLLSFTDSENVTHNIWRISDAQTIGVLAAEFANKPLYIADGHHRYETALRYRNHLREKGEIASDDTMHPANFIMMTLVSIEDPGLWIWPTHRLLSGLENFSEETALASLAARGFTYEYFSEVQAVGRILAERPDSKVFGFYTGKKGFWLLTSPKNSADIAGKSSAYCSLDVTVLHNDILEPVFGIDKKNMAAQKNLTYTRSLEEAIDKTANGECQCAFFINPTKITELAAVSEAGEKMPQKSTYFYPKLTTGHVINPLYR